MYICIGGITFILFVSKGLMNNKQLLDEVEHDIMNYKKPRSVSVLSAEAEDTPNEIMQ